MAEQNSTDRDEMVRDFCDMCDASPAMATQYLEAHNWDYLSACNTFFADDDDKRLDDILSRERDQEPYNGPRTLDGRPAPQAYRRSRNNDPPAKKKGVATLASLASGSQQGGGDDDDDDVDDDDLDGDTEDGRGNLFAGGEKSGLAVQDPKQEGGSRQIINDILAKARANASRPDTASEAGPSRSSRFRGTGMTLGGEGVQSRAVPDPLGPVRPTSSQPLERVLHIWQDGFSIDDGELRRYDDPANRADLQMIRSGRAPLHLMNVQHDQLVDVKLHQHDTPYTPPPKQYKPFGGSGHRLGSPVPGATSDAPDTMAGASTTTAGASTMTTTTTPATTATASEPTVDSSQPTVMIRIQLPDGTRLPARFNTTHTVGDVYGFIQGASPETRTREWVLVTTFPNKEHKDKALVLGEMPEFKKGGTAVVKWA
ncbi:hypothetical protein XA68_18063 [Ophiocordyceps unilateralis]|uniref:UBX domain-containing protein n=1 Tax=Ophiocordyceps unilateralis TaxID=268505 RepID=A0A2A9PJX2_OPHUN|nr:hypothetical protein XA68_18063 [Ophiocordyceps unilateralis]